MLQARGFRAGSVVSRPRATGPMQQLVTHVTEVTHRGGRHENEVAGI